MSRPMISNSRRTAGDGFATPKRWAPPRSTAERSARRPLTSMNSTAERSARTRSSDPSMTSSSTRCSCGEVATSISPPTSIRHPAVVGSTAMRIIGGRTVSRRTLAMTWTPLGAAAGGVARRNTPRSAARAVSCGIVSGLAQPLDRRSDDPRDLHLRDAEARADLRLRQILGEAQPQHVTVSIAEDAHQVLDVRGAHRLAVAGILGANRIVRPLAPVRVFEGLHERQSSVRAGGREGLEHPLGGDSEALGELVDRRRVPGRLRNVTANALQAECELLELARQPKRPPCVAEVAPQLTQDRRDGEAREGGGALEVEAVDCLQQAERCDLHQIVERLTSASIAARQLARQWQEPLGERAARRAIAVMVISGQQPAFLAH